VTAQLVAVRTLSKDDAARIHRHAAGHVVAAADERWTWVEVATGRDTPTEVAVRLSKRSPLAVLLTVGELRSTVRAWRAGLPVVEFSVARGSKVLDFVDARRVAEELARSFGVEAADVVAPLRDPDPAMAWPALLDALELPVPRRLVPSVATGTVLHDVPGATLVPPDFVAPDLAPSGRPQPSGREKVAGVVALVVLLVAVGLSGRWLLPVLAVLAVAGLAWRVNRSR
jgi:hypothetical protein